MEKTLLEKILFDRPLSSRSRGSFIGIAALFAVLIGLLASQTLSASETKNFSLGLSAAIGGPLDSNGTDPGTSNTGYGLHFSWWTQPQTKVVVRAAQVDLGDGFFGNLSGAELGYVNIGGEYTFKEAYYTSGFYIGLGLYRLEGSLASPAGFVDEQTSSIGAVFGVTADFSITETVSAFGDLSFHYADLDQAQFFAFLNVGIAYHF